MPWLNSCEASTSCPLPVFRGAASRLWELEAKEAQLLALRRDIIRLVDVALVGGRTDYEAHRAGLSLNRAAGMIGSPRAAHALPYNPRRPRSRGGERFDRSTKYFLPVNADTGFVDGYSVRRISQIEAIISGVPEYRLIRALKQRKRRFWRPGCDTNYPRPHQRAPNQVDTDDRGKACPPAMLNRRVYPKAFTRRA